MALDLGAMRQRVHDYFEHDGGGAGTKGRHPPLRLGRAALQVTCWWRRACSAICSFCARVR